MDKQEQSIRNCITVVQDEMLEQGLEQAAKIVRAYPDICRWATIGFIESNPYLNMVDMEPGEMSIPWAGYAEAYLFECGLSLIMSGDYYPKY